MKNQTAVLSVFLFFSLFLLFFYSTNLSAGKMMSMQKSCRITVQVAGMGTIRMENQQNSSSYSANGGKVTSIMAAGTEIKLSAEAASGWKFKSWSGDIETAENPYSFVLEEDLEIKALFTEIPAGDIHESSR